MLRFFRKSQLPMTWQEKCLDIFLIILAALLILGILYVIYYFLLGRDIAGKAMEIFYYR